MVPSSKRLAFTALAGLVLGPCCTPAFAQTGGPKRGAGMPPYVQFHDSFLIASPRGDEVASVNAATGKTTVVRLAGPGGPRLRAHPVVGPGVAAWQIGGKKITRLVAAAPDGTLVAHDLVEPAQGGVSPFVGTGVAAYVVGHHAYAFSPALKRWDVVKLADGHDETPMVGPGTATLAAPGHVYAFGAKAGKWQDVDFGKLFGDGGKQTEEPEEDR